ncbi:MAG: glycosyltransferase family 1 protein [Gammaproteobacteria bacterium]|nr:glycosyltransferase family 1 protein [Gammaproteobacteria bacterium]
MDCAEAAGRGAERLKLLFVVTEDWYFISHRLPLALAARAAGFEVAVATRAGRQAQLIGEAGLRLIPFELSRRGGNPLREVLALWRLYRREQPDLVHHVALKPVMFGALAAWLARVPAQVNAVAGLGWLFTSSSGIVRLARPLLRWVLARLLNQPQSLTIVQNPDDRAALEQAGVAATRLRLIRGAGVDVQIFYPVVPPPAPVCVALVARMLRDKGVGEFVAAAERLTGAGVNARFILVGEPDPANPASVPAATLRTWHGQHGVEWWGQRADMAAVLQTMHIACLPSYYGEGLPKSLLEAAACGLPIVTSDAPGCREIVREGVNGLLVPVRDVDALVVALRKLIDDPGLRLRLGEQSRLLVETAFSLEIVLEQTLAVYRELGA